MTWKRFGLHIVAQKRETEVLIVDLRTGVYYNLGGSGALMWDAIDQGYSRQQVVQSLSNAYQETTDELLSQSLTEFVDQLVAEDLIKPVEASAAESRADNKGVVEKRTFAPPTVSRFLNTDAEFSKRAQFRAWQPAVPHVVSSTVDGDVLVVHAQKGISCMVAGCGGRIWRGIADGSTTEQIVLSLLSHYDVSADAAKQEVDEFIAKLAASDLIQPKEASNERPSDGACSSDSAARQPFVRAAITIDDNREGALKHITESNGWQVSAPQIVSETIEDEVIAVDLQAGVYHSITGAGAIIWEGILQESSCDEIVESLVAHYDVNAATARKELDNLVSRMAEFNLIRPLQKRPERINFAPPPTPASKQPFAPAAMVIYTDMESVLRLDPIHDFDEYGWPSQTAVN